MTKLIFGFLVVAIVGGCAHKAVDSNWGVSNVPPQFQNGLTALKEERYADAADLFDHLLVAHPATEYDLVVLFDSASAYEGMGECRTAAKRYRQLTLSEPGKFERIKSEAMFHLGLMYECLGDDVKTITALMDAKRIGESLPLEVRVGEIPARLAAAYARLGNRKRALVYFNEASRGLRTVVSDNGPHVNKGLLGRTLYMMGKLNSNQRQARVRPMKYLASISMQQPYLLQAMDLNTTTWSGKAAEDLSTAYDNLWKFNIKDPHLQRAFLIRALQTVNELKGLRIPSQIPIEVGFFQDLDRHESRIKDELAKVAITTKLTPEAKRRQGLKRQGRLTK